MIAPVQCKRCFYARIRCAPAQLEFHSLRGAFGTETAPPPGLHHYTNSAPTQRGDAAMATTTPDDVLKLIKDKEVKFVDLRFTDTRGKEQHVTVPVKYFGKDKFEAGDAFDGASIAGWKGNQASVMLLVPDPAR